MSVSIPAASARQSNVLLAAILGVLAIALIWFVGQRLYYVSDYSERSYTPYFWARRFGLLAHLAGGMLAITAGMVQIWLGLTGRTSTPHRVLGKVYATGVLVGSIGAFYLALTIHDNLAYSSGLFMLSVAWLVTTGMALYAIRRRRLEQHRDWMLRSYTVTFAFVTFRLFESILHYFVTIPAGATTDPIDTIMAWACWSVPLLLAEPLIQLRRFK